MPEINNASVSEDFLIAEFGAIHDQIIKLEEAKTNRVNFFILLVAAAVAGVVGMSTSEKILISINTLLIFVAFSVLALGVATMNELVHCSESIVSLYRRANRVRRWFYDSNTEIAPYLAFEPTDEKPPYDLGSTYLAFRGGDSIVLLMNSVSFAVFMMSCIRFYHSMPTLLAIIIGIIIILLTFLFQNYRLHNHLKKRELSAKANVHFPVQSLPSFHKSDEGK